MTYERPLILFDKATRLIEHSNHRHRQPRLRSRLLNTTNRSTLHAFPRRHTIAPFTPSLSLPSSPPHRWAKQPAASRKAALRRPLQISEPQTKKRPQAKAQRRPIHLSIYLALHKPANQPPTPRQSRRLKAAPRQTGQTEAPRTTTPHRRLPGVMSAADSCTSERRTRSPTFVGRGQRREKRTKLRCSARPLIRSQRSRSSLRPGPPRAYAWSTSKPRSSPAQSEKSNSLKAPSDSQAASRSDPTHVA